MQLILHLFLQSLEIICLSREKKPLLLCTDLIILLISWSYRTHSDSKVLIKLCRCIQTLQEICLIWTAVCGDYASVSAAEENKSWFPQKLPEMKRWHLWRVYVSESVWTDLFDKLQMHLLSETHGNKRVDITSSSNQMYTHVEYTSHAVL